MIKPIITTTVASLALVFSINSFAVDVSGLSKADANPAPHASKNAEAAVPFSKKLEIYQEALPKALCTSKNSKPGLKKLGVDVDSLKACMKNVGSVVYVCINQLQKKNLLNAQTTAKVSGELIGGCVYGYFKEQYNENHPHNAIPATKSAN